MMRTIKSEMLNGVWSATPTPFTDQMDIDTASVERMIEHQVRLGIKGLFLAGTCGEGPWMTDGQKSKLIQNVARFNQRRLLLTAQVTDNSAARILDNIKRVQDDGADVAVIAPPYFLDRKTPEIIFDLYHTAISKSPLPIGIYDRGKFGNVFVPDAVMKKLYMEKNVILVKDSSADMKRMKVALAAKKKRPSLRLFTGWEFNTVPYIKNGYDGMLLGGGIFNGYLAGEIFEAARSGDFKKADDFQAKMNRMMYQVFGGKNITCWLSGQKKLLVEMGIFKTWKSYLNYPLTNGCIKAIKKVLVKDADVLFPWKGN
jgi:4-hydroxy-tetrahydrodipicolinate synthase